MDHSRIAVRDRLKIGARRGLNTSDSPVNDSFRVHVLERGDQLSGIEPRRVLVQFTGRLLLNVCAQVAASREFRHEIVHGSALQAGVKLNRYRFASIALS